MFLIVNQVSRKAMILIAVNVPSVSWVIDVIVGAHVILIVIQNIHIVLKDHTTCNYALVCPILTAYITNHIVIRFTIANIRVFV